MHRLHSAGDCATVPEQLDVDRLTNLRCYGCCRSKRSSGWAAHAPSASACAWWRRRSAIWCSCWRRGSSTPTSTTVSTSFPSHSRHCATDRRIFPCRDLKTLRDTHGVVGGAQSTAARLGVKCTTLMYKLTSSVSPDSRHDKLLAGVDDGQSMHDSSLPWLPPPPPLRSPGRDGRRKP
jgi:hypothetical protein